jgi:hypothetical protein
MNHLWLIKYLLFILLHCGVYGILQAQTFLNKKITIPTAEGSTEKLLDVIGELAKVSFSYSNKICLKDTIVLSSRSNTIAGFLNELFIDCPIDIKEKRNKLILLPHKVVQKNSFVISGYIKSAEDGEILIGASVYDSKKLLGTASNNFGYYSITLPKGDVFLNSSFVGYKIHKQRLQLTKDTVVNIHLLSQSLLEEVPVIGLLTPEGINSTRTGTINIPVKQIQKVPSFLGEVDVIKTLQLLPGINGGNEGLSGLYVRGGSVDQNLYLLDDIPIYNISHFFGFFSVFNADAINNVTVTKGGFPARYGSRLSSVIDIRLKDGNNQKLKGVVSLGMMSSKLALDGPLFKEKTTFNLSIRRSYFDLFALPLQSNQNTKNAFFFYDANIKISHYFSDKSKLYFSVYGGRDKFYTKYNYTEIQNPANPTDINDKLTINDQNYAGWGNTLLSLRWNKVFSDQLFSNVSLSYSNYGYFVGYEEHDALFGDWNSFEQKYRSGIQDILFKADFDYYMNPKHYIRFGGSFINHKFNPGIDVIRKSLNTEVLLDSTIGGKNIYGEEVYLYLEDDFFVTDELKVNVGLHASLYANGKNTYLSLQPRVLSRYLLTPNVAIKMSYSRMTQYMHLLSGSSVTLPTDLWIPVGDNIKPQHATQYNIGSVWKVISGIEFSVEAYFKKYENLINYTKKGINKKARYFWEEQTITGTGYSRGIEFLIRKKRGRLSGWFGYTLSEGKQQFEQINNGDEFPLNNDRGHDVGIFTSFLVNSKIDVSATWSFSSGNAVTLPSHKYYRPILPSQGTMQANTYSEYSSNYNGYRMPLSHRLDLGANFRKKNKLGERIWSIGLYNAYGRQNAFSLYFDNDINEITGEEERRLKQLSIFPLPMPYVKYTLKF